MYKKLLIIIFAVLLAALPVLSAIYMPKEENAFSENENRYLASFPKISLDRLTNKSFMEGFDKWVSDMFAGRENWITAKNNTEKLLGKNEINGVYTRSDRMIQSWKDFDRTLTDKSLEAVNSFAKRHPEIPVYFMLAPTAQEIYYDTLPANAPAKSQKNYIKYCYDALTSVTCIDVIGTLNENRERYIYYRTDHHWTSLGAYFAYAAAASKMNYTALPLGDFDIEHASGVFRGTLYSKTLDLSVTSDIIDIYTVASGEPEVYLNIPGNRNEENFNSLYFREYLEKKDKYSTFLGTNSPVMNIKSGLKDNDRKLLVFKDSYAHCLIPFFAKNYSTITVLDMRYINVDYSELVNVEEYDQVLFVYNVISFSEDGNIRKLG